MVSCEVATSQCANDAEKRALAAACAHGVLVLMRCSNTSWGSIPRRMIDPIWMMTIRKQWWLYEPPLFCPGPRAIVFPCRSTGFQRQFRQAAQAPFGRLANLVPLILSERAVLFHAAPTYHLIAHTDACESSEAKQRRLCDNLLGVAFQEVSSWKN